MSVSHNIFMQVCWPCYSWMGDKLTGYQIRLGMSGTQQHCTPKHNHCVITMFQTCFKISFITGGNLLTICNNARDDMIITGQAPHSHCTSLITDGLQLFSHAAVTPGQCGPGQASITWASVHSVHCPVVSDIMCWAGHWVCQTYWIQHVTFICGPLVMFSK